MVNHYAEAERLLAEAEALVNGPRVSVSRAIAAIARGHALLALTKAVRESGSTDLDDLVSQLTARVGETPTADLGPVT